MRSEILSDRNIVFVVLDSLSAFNMGCYGYERDTTPFLDELADENLFFKYVYSNGPWTVPSHASIFSGKLPEGHGTTSEDMEFKADSFIEDLSCDTLLMSHNPLVSETLNFDKGFDEVWEGNDIIVDSRYGGSEAWYKTDTDSGFTQMAKDLGTNSLRHREPLMPLKVGYNYLRNVKFRKGNRGGKLAKDEGGKDLVNLMVDEVSEREEFFLFANFLETHEYSATKEVFKETGWCDVSYEEAMKVAEKGGVLPEITEREGKILRDLYDMQIRYADSLMENLYHRIREEHPDTIFVFTSDHGQNVNHYNHYTWDHQYAIWERLIRVPLIIAGNEIESNEVEENFSLRKIGKIFQDGVSPKDLTSEKVRSSYAGAKGFFFGDSSSIDEYDRWEKNYIRNESEAIIRSDELFVENSELDNFTFKVRDEGYIQDTSQDIDGENDFKSMIEDSDASKTEEEEEVKEKLKDLGYM